MVPLRATSGSVGDPFDALARRNRTHPISTGKRITLQDRDVLWLQKLHQHGPLPSSFLLAYTSDMRRSEKRAKERLTDLFNEDNTLHGGPYLTRPPQQFRTLDSRYNQLVYDLAPAAIKALEDADHWHASSGKRPGPWLHGFMVSCITASIELATHSRNDISYIPATAILKRAGTELRFPTVIADPVSNRQHEKLLIPDALFGLEYHAPSGSRFRFFLVEADRSTEPATSKNFNRKSFLRNLLQYQKYIGDGLYRDHLKLTAPLMVLSVTSSEQRMEQMLRAGTRHAPTLAAHLLFQNWDDFGVIFRPPTPNAGLLENTWTRAEMEPFAIDRA